MNAAVFKQAGGPLVIEEVVDPEPGPDDLIIKVKACGICGTDLHWSQGIDSTAGWRDLLLCFSAWAGSGAKRVTSHGQFNPHDLV